MTQECQHGRQHTHHHHHHVGLAEGITPKYVKKLQWVMLLSLLYFVSQLVGSFYSGSLALMADAGHKLADITAIALALFAAWFAHLSASSSKTFGFYRLEILAATINAIALVFVAGFIMWEAIQRAFHHGEVEIHGGIMLGVSLLGLAINLISAKILFPARELNLNVKGALFHVMADIANSIGELVTAVSILLFKAYWLDTLVSGIIAGLVLYNALRILVEAINILMEAAPQHLNVAVVKDFIMRRPGVKDVHDLHIWTITTGKEALLAHVKVDDASFQHETIRQLENDLREQYDLCHITLQLEPHDHQEAEILF